jgi:hypothetical protein
VRAKRRFDGCAARAAAIAPPQAWEGPGETTPPLSIVRGPALDVAPPNAAPRALALAALPDGAKLVASAGDVAYYFTGTE